MRKDIAIRSQYWGLLMTAGEINQEAIRELYPLRTIGGCFIKKPVETDHLMRQLIAGLE